MMMGRYIESEVLELKEKYTDTIVKEIVAFLNTRGGTVVIGVKDNGEIVGVRQVDDTLQKLADIITSQIAPNPQSEIKIETSEIDNQIVIIINIQKGSEELYYQKKYGITPKGCPVRVGTTCQEMTDSQIKLKFERKFIDNDLLLKKRSSYQELSFEHLEIYYRNNKRYLDIKTFEKTLQLRNAEGQYNLLAELLADENMIPLIFVKFRGVNKSAISERSDYGNQCLLTAYERIKNRLIAENICLSDTTIRPRRDVYLFDFDCVNEAVINALVHNDWTITEPQISMFSDRIEILSHGGLPRGVTEADFFQGISFPRNHILMRVFLHTKIAEHTGHGIPTILEKYGREVFTITERYIRCTFPFNQEVLKNRENINVITKVININNTEKKVMDCLLENPRTTAKKISTEINVSKRTVERALKSLQEKELLKRIGSKKNGNWLVLN